MASKWALEEDSTTRWPTGKMKLLKVLRGAARLMHAPTHHSNRLAGSCLWRVVKSR
jgi:hypothetical protein